MKAIVIHAAKDLRIDERELEMAGPGEVEIRLAAGGICGSDLHYYNHGGFGTVRVKEPMILGHEVSGHIAALGEGVSGLAIGDLVAISPSRPCGHCEYCHKGLPNHCFNMRFYGSAMPFPHIQGAFRERLVAKASQCVKADGLSAGEAAMAEPLSVTLHATRRAGEILGKRVLVTGCGPIGTLSILSARRAGAAEIVAADISGPALDFARKVGADRTVNLSENPDGLAEYAQNKGSFDILYECSGAASALVAGIHAIRPRGVIVQLGMGGEMNLPIMTITAKELDLRGSFRFHEEFAIAVKLMQDGLIDVNPLITQTLPLSDALRAFDIASDKTKSMKTQIAFS
ncbi:MULTISPECIES: L-idonate 5-dehydrogenase [Brucella/Ochrobactrum group]|uniref:L-idonate 5-dehydrogenase n=2 Tax=Ochrobactrum TaxID=528 RepID=A0ABD5JQN8_9HYPH|nr:MULTISPECIES: L-idonate 5-dehydrogenase [Brucella]MCI1002603.1 L-idonate 5-dehydrogenase [Ochrobactrum sp. C6C9]RRD22625.1 L-idonate 5-dehydrogenase [Brucellaceae bacterium VT-16-1752]MDX4073167.1 L-idonate 5-dehydrogenase [Brucella sp. NBRC 113783]RLL76697.1 L-idonate 5-dehydrogenase [[Ochrobactrum] soli]SPL65466.1 L-idonate 5-dehydrogenase [[Ochrobactrum] soli]